MKAPKDPKAYLDARTYTRLRHANSVIGSESGVPHTVRRWIVARNNKAGTKLIANQLWHDIQSARKALDELERIICSEPGVPFKRKPPQEEEQ